MSDAHRSTPDDAPSRPDRPQPKPAQPAPCPTCGGEVDAAAGHAPFCSTRCRMADLNRWFSGDYVISRELKETDLDELE